MLAHQHLSKLEEEEGGDAILGNAGTLVSFRVGRENAELLEREFEAEVMAADLPNLRNYHVHLKLMVDGGVSARFSGQTLVFAAHSFLILAILV